MWTKIFFNTQNIQSDTGRSVLIKMPNKSQYNGWVFWHPKKLVREQGGKGYHSAFSFTEDWIFKVKLYGKGRYNSKDVIREVELEASEMKEIWGIVDENVNEFVQLETEKIIEKETEYITIEKHIPKVKLPVENNQIKDLER